MSPFALSFHSQLPVPPTMSVNWEGSPGGRVWIFQMCSSYRTWQALRETGPSEWYPLHEGGKLVLNYLPLRSWLIMPKGVCVEDEQPRWGTTSTGRVGMKHVTFFFKIYLIIYVFILLHWVFVAARCPFSSCHVQGHGPVAVCGLLIAMASHVAESTGSRLLGFSRYSLWALEFGLSSCGHGLSFVACGLLRTRDQIHVPALAGRFPPTGPPEKSWLHPWIWIWTG